MNGYYGLLFAALAHTALALACLRLLVGLRPLPAPLPALACALGLTVLWAGHGVAMSLLPHASGPGLQWLLDLLRYGCWFVFLLGLLCEGGLRDAPLAPRLLAVGAGLLLAASLAPALALMLASWRPMPRWPWAPMAWMGLPILGLVLVEQVLRNTPQARRWALKPLALGLAGTFAFDLHLASRSVLLSEAHEASLPLRGAVQALSAPLLWAFLRRQGASPTRFALSRPAAFHTAALLLVSGYLLLVALAGYSVRDFDAAWGPALQLTFLFAALLALAVLAVSGTARSALRVAVSRTFFRYRYDYRTEWQRFTARLAARAGRQDLGEAVVQGLAEMVESPAGVLWMPHADGERFVPALAWNMPGGQGSEARDSPFVRFLREREWIVDADEFRRSPHHYAGLRLPGWLAAPPRQWLVIPLPAGEDLAGFVVLAPPRVPVRVDWEVRDLLKTAARQAAAFLAHVAATEALMESRRFESFSRMSAFVVHDLKNVVTQLSLMTRNARRLHADPEFQRDMLATVESSLEKMRRLILQLRQDPAGGAGNAASGSTDLAPIARRLQALASVQGRSIELQAPVRLRVRGDEERLFRVLGHLVQNALDATTPTERVWLHIGSSAQHAELVVGDAGRGMTREFVESRLFRPFHTTKPQGMGIGFYESVCYVRELGGRVEVESAPGRGTRVIVRLPLSGSSHPSPLEEANAR